MYGMYIVVFTQIGTLRRVCILYCTVHRVNRLFFGPPRLSLTRTRVGPGVGCYRRAAVNETKRLDVLVYLRFGSVEMAVGWWVAWKGGAMGMYFGW